MPAQHIMDMGIMACPWECILLPATLFFHWEGVGSGQAW